MKQTYQVLNVKCEGCAGTLKKALAKRFGEVSVNLDVMPREITLEIDSNEEDALKVALRHIGYPLSSDNLSGFQKATTTATSFVSCAIGKVNN